MNEAYPWSKLWLDVVTLIVSLATLIVLAITMAYVINYAGSASEQNRHLADSVAQQAMMNRPVVFANGIHREGSDVYPVQVQANIVNFGKTVALEVVAPGEIASTPSEEPAPRDPRCRENGDPPKDLYMTALAQVDAVMGSPSYYPAHWKLASYEDISKMGGRTLYAVGCVYYKGLDRTLTIAMFARSGLITASNLAVVATAIV